VIALTRWFWDVVTAGAVVSVLLALLAIDLIAPLDLNSSPGPLTWLHLQLLKVDPERCYAALDRAQINYKRWSEPIQNGCGFDYGAKLLGSEISHGNNFLMTCHGLAGLILWERGVVAPAAERYFGGSKLTRVQNMGTYSCRNIEHKKDKMRSEHATANAIDVGSFGFSNGAQVVLEKDWKDKGDKGAFLREIRDGACKIFSVVLSPDYNPNHSNHFHLDMSFVRFCR
jgi:hypothetical protein